MKLLFKAKDGGLESSVTGYWLIEWKPVFSIVLLKFEGKSRDAYHTHAFNCLNWLIKGHLVEHFLKSFLTKEYFASIIPFVIRREDFHKVDSIGTSWVLSFRGPWLNTWMDFSDKLRVLTHGRVQVT